MDELTENFKGLTMATKRSYVEAFLEKEALESSTSKKSTRLELARAENRKETAYQNMKKNQRKDKKNDRKMSRTRSRI